MRPASGLPEALERLRCRSPNSSTIIAACPQPIIFILEGSSQILPYFCAHRRPERNSIPGSLSTAKLVPFFAATDNTPRRIGKTQRDQRGAIQCHNVGIQPPYGRPTWRGPRTGAAVDGDLSVAWQDGIKGWLTQCRIPSPIVPSAKFFPL